MKYRTFLLGLTLLVVTGCSGSASDPDLSQAIAALRTMASPSVMPKSCFSVVYPDGKPSDFIKYIFSDLGAAEWPIAMDEFEAEQMKSIGQATLPDNVRISPLNRQEPNGKEVVLEPNDGEGLILLKAYVADSEKVNVEKEIPLATATPDPGVRELCDTKTVM